MILPDRAAPVLVADLFPAERVALLGMLRSLSPAEWSSPTVCAGWPVKDVALHLLAGDLSKLARGRDGFDAPPGTVPLPSPTDFVSLVAFLDALNARRVRELRWLSTPVLVDLLAATGPALHAYLAELDPFEPGERVSWAGEAPAPNWLDVAREFTERWVHQQQIREAVGRPGLVQPHLLHPVLATFARALPRALRDADAVVDSSVLLHVTGLRAASGTQSASRPPGCCTSIRPARQPPPSCSTRTPPGGASATASTPTQRAKGRRSPGTRHLPTRCCRLWRSSDETPRHANTPAVWSGARAALPSGSARPGPPGAAASYARAADRGRRNRSPTPAKRCLAAIHNGPSANARPCSKS